MRKNAVQKIGYGNIAGLVLIALSVITSIGMIASAQGFNQNTGTNTGNSTVTSAICNVFNTIKNVIFILGLALMVLGGAVYAGANLMPSQSRGGFQGYGMAMVIGGVIGVAIAVAAPYILNLIIGASGGGGSFLTNSSTGTGNLNTGTSSTGASGQVQGVTNNICSGTTNGNLF